MIREEFLELVHRFSQARKADFTSSFIAYSEFEEYRGQRGRLISAGIQPEERGDLYSFTIEWKNGEIEVIVFWSEAWEFKWDGNKARITRKRKAEVDSREKIPVGINCFEIQFPLF